MYQSSVSPPPAHAFCISVWGCFFFFVFFGGGVVLIFCLDGGIRLQRVFWFPLFVEEVCMRRRVLSG